MEKAKDLLERFTQTKLELNHANQVIIQGVETTVCRTPPSRGWSNANCKSIGRENKNLIDASKAQQMSN